jgi:hypothetical protein
MADQAQYFSALQRQVDSSECVCAPIMFLDADEGDDAPWASGL